MKHAVISQFAAPPVIHLFSSLWLFSNIPSRTGENRLVGLSYWWWWWHLGNSCLSLFSPIIVIISTVNLSTPHSSIHHPSLLNSTAPLDCSLEGCAARRIQHSCECEGRGSFLTQQERKCYLFFIDDLMIRTKYCHRLLDKFTD